MPPTTLSSVELLQHELTVCRNELANLRTRLRATSAQFNKQCKEILLALERQGLTDVATAKPRADGPVQGSGFTFQPIGRIQTPFPFKNGTPRQGCICPDSQATLTLDKRVFTCPEHSLEGLDQFSHVWLLSVFDRNARKEGSSSSSELFAYRSKVQPPRLGGQTWGVLASRSPHRPCPVGLTLARLHSVQGCTLHLSGVDLVDGTPILDVKPYLPQYDSPQGLGETGGETPEDVRWAPWIKEASTLAVDFTPRAHKELLQFHGRSSHDGASESSSCPWCLHHFEDCHAAARGLAALLKADPRSVHRKDNCSDRLYFCVLDAMHVTAWFDKGRAEVLRLRPRDEGESTGS